MQSSESAGLPVNTLGTEDSIKQGCKYFSELVAKADKLGCDMDAIIQAYNYGSGFLDFVARNGKRYTFELAQEFSRQHSGGVKVTYKNEISTPINGGWRYNYGNMFYVKLVRQYLTQTGGDALGTDAQNRIVEVARNSAKYGISAAGGYCEAWAEEVYRKAGVSIDQHCCAGKNRALYTVGKSSKNIPLGAMVYNDPAVYQSRTNDTCGRNAGHVGIYIGNGEIVHFDGSPNEQDAAAVRVRRTGMEEFLRGGLPELRIYGRAERKLLRAPDEIAAAALSAVGRSGYDYRTNNCEHFSNECAFGEHYSRQSGEGNE